MISGHSPLCTRFSHVTIEILLSQKLLSCWSKSGQSLPSCTVRLGLGFFLFCFFRFLDLVNLFHCEVLFVFNYNVECESFLVSLVQRLPSILFGFLCPAMFCPLLCLTLFPNTTGCSWQKINSTTHNISQAEGEDLSEQVAHKHSVQLKRKTKPEAEPRETLIQGAQGFF